MRAIYLIQLIMAVPALTQKPAIQPFGEDKHVSTKDAIQMVEQREANKEVYQQRVERTREQLTDAKNIDKFNVIVKFVDYFVRYNAIEGVSKFELKTDSFTILMESGIELKSKIEEQLNLLKESSPLTPKQSKKLQELGKFKAELDAELDGNKLLKTYLRSAKIADTATNGLRRARSGVKKGINAIFTPVGLRTPSPELLAASPERPQVQPPAERRGPRPV
eukprot:NODE_157_length_16664_cov_0.301781.p7 type:complete len:221 gc:universal NODE_157_length_16664_cov_0.301781:14825-15487(+)